MSNITDPKHRAEMMEKIAMWGKPKRQIVEQGVNMTLRKKQGSPEAEIQKAIMQYLKAGGVFCWRNSTGAMRTQDNRFLMWGAVGSPDIIAIRPQDGKFIGIECKTPKGVQSSHQRQFQANVEKSNGVYILARSVDDVMAII
jgi:hypothetical protein